MSTVELATNPAESGNLADRYILVEIADACRREADACQWSLNPSVQPVEWKRPLAVKIWTTHTHPLTQAVAAIARSGMESGVECNCHGTQNSRTQLSTYNKAKSIKAMHPHRASEVYQESDPQRSKRLRGKTHLQVNKSSRRTKSKSAEMQTRKLSERLRR